MRITILTIIFVGLVLVGTVCIASAQTITPGSRTTQLNPTQRAAVAAYWPDGNMCAVLNGSTYYSFAPTAAPGTVGVTMPNLAAWSGLSKISVTTNLAYGASGAFDQNYIGGGSCYYDSGSGLLIALYHGEQWFGGSGSPFYSALGMATSADYGVHWTKLGEVISPQAAWVNGGTNCQAEVGNGTLTVVGSYFYAYYTDTVAGCTGSVKVAVARASVSSVISAAVAGTPFTSGAGTLFMKYTGSGTWTGDGVTNLANPQNGGGAFTQVATVPSGTMYEPNVRFDTYADVYLMAYTLVNAANTTSEIDAQTSTDGLTWSNIQALVTGGNGFGGSNMIYYPTLLNTGGGDPQTLGQNFSLFYVQPFNQPSTGWTNSNLYSVALAISGGGSGIITAASCSQSDVQAAFNSVTAATTQVVIPACPSGVTWTATSSPGVTLNIPSGSTSLTVQGQTSCTGAGNPNSSTSGVVTCTDNTLILNGQNLPANDPPLLSITTAAGGLFRMTGITIRGNGTTQTYGGTIDIFGAGACRVDHNDLVNNNALTMNVGSSGQSCVLDHNILSQPNAGVLVKTNGATANDWAGMIPWSQSTNPGSGSNVYLEDNYVIGGSSDCDHGGRFVMRFNTFVAESGTAQFFLVHPTGPPGGPLRGCREWEVYGNKMSVNGNYTFSAWFNSSGTGVDWGNSSVNTGGGNLDNWWTLVSIRSNNTTYSQTATPNGWGYCGTNFNGTGSTWDQNTSTATGYRCMDNPGTGQGDLLTAGPATSPYSFPNIVNTTTGTIAWPHQASEPIYSWMDTTAGTTNWVNESAASAATIIQNSDFYLWCNASSQNGCTTFNGTVGVGSGTLAARPSTCTAGVAYWATDQGNWNQSGSGGQGQLFKCTSTNTWSLFYTPYTYPNPLEAGGVTPSPPTGVSVIVIY